VRLVSVRRGFSAICIALIGLAAFAANTSAKTPDLSGPKSFHHFPVYWAGAEVAGLPLEDISEGNGFTFFYGDCELRGTDHPSCAPPVQIQVGSTCSRWASELNKVKDLVPFRGAKAIWHPGIPLEGGGEDEAGPLEIFTGRVTVVIFVEPYELKEGYGLHNPKKVAFEVTEALRTIHQSKPRPLSPPVAGSLTGRLACQKKTAKQFH
jgi:hypothetical protein